MNIKNRVKEMRMMSATEISANEKNWRTHPDKQTRALSGILEEIGIAGALLCYHSERNGGALTLIDGHLRKEVAPGEEWPVLITDLTDAEADTLLAVYDPVAAMAGAERERLAALIEGVRVQDARLRELVAGVAEKELDYFNVGVVDAPEISDGDRGKFQQMTFTLHESQVETVKMAIKKAKNNCKCEINKNSNGNALAFVCSEFLDG